MWASGATIFWQVRSQLAKQKIPLFIDRHSVTFSFLSVVCCLYDVSASLIATPLFVVYLLLLKPGSLFYFLFLILPSICHFFLGAVVVASRRQSPLTSLYSIFPLISHWRCFCIEMVWWSHVTSPWIIQHFANAVLLHALCTAYILSFLDV